MSIEKVDIVSFLNSKLNRSEGANALDVDIQTVLDELSELDLLVGTDATQTLVSGDLTLNYPTGLRCPVSIVLINSSSVRGAPLEKLPGGHREYRELRDSDTATGEPQWYSEFDSKFWLWRPANGNYTTEIEYYKNHPQDVDSIEFGDEFRNAIYFGVAFHYACGKPAPVFRYAATYGPLYERAKERLRVSAPQQPYITR